MPVLSCVHAARAADANTPLFIANITKDESDETRHTPLRGGSDISGTIALVRGLIPTALSNRLSEVQIVSGVI